MTRWKIKIEYDGRGFSGWQRQANALSVQEAIEAAITRFTGEAVTVHTAGRTDAGVHALAQTAHFDLAKDVREAEVFGALNFHLRPHPVTLLSAEKVDETFHARFSATGRAYLYVIVNRRGPLALETGRAWHVCAPLDHEAMAEAASLLIGKHDFSTFRAQGCQAKSPLRTLSLLTVRRQGEHVLIQAQARSFLYHQMRNMVGSLVLVGKGRWTLADFERAFKAADRAQGGPTAPPDGLYFAGAFYGESPEADPSLPKNES